MSTILAASLLCASLSAPQAPQRPAPAPAPVSDQDADEAARTPTTGDLTLYEFENDTVDGETMSPGGAHVNARVSPLHPSLLRVRAHFIPELIELSFEL